MLKLLLLMVILLSCGGIGRAISRRHKLRCEQQADILAAMRVLRLRMLNTAEPLGVLLRKSSCLLFQELGNSLWEGEGLGDCWRKMREKGKEIHASISALPEDDLQILDAFFKGLGSSGKDEQNALFAEMIARLEEAQHQAKHTSAETTKVYTALGTLVGVGICILII